MAVNWTWPKSTGLTVIQTASAAILSALGGNAVNALHLDVEQLFGLGAGAGLVAFLTAVVAYKVPSAPAALISAPVAAGADAQAAVAALPDVSPPHDINGARGW